MSRRLRAILLGANVTRIKDEHGKPLDTVPEALDQVAALKRELEQRFDSASRDLVALTGKGVTRANLLAALKKARQKTAAGDLVVLMFSGHGARLPANEGWVFWSDIFTDVDLATELNRFSKGAEVVVVSDCCYAAGIFTPGPKNLRKGMMQLLAKGWAMRVLGFSSLLAKSAQPADCIIIASVRAGLGSVSKVRFVEVMCEKLAGDPSYEELGERLDAALAVSVVDARPAKLLKRTAFSAS